MAIALRVCAMDYPMGMLLLFASESQIEEIVHETIEILNRDGGYIFAAAHNIQPDVDPRSLTVMLNAAYKYRKA